MLTRCNHCQTCFEINERLVRDNDATVACGECGAVFDARLNLVDEYSGEYYRFADDLPAPGVPTAEYAVEETGYDAFDEARWVSEKQIAAEDNAQEDAPPEIERTVVLDPSGLESPYVERSIGERVDPEFHQPLQSSELRHFGGERGLPEIYLEDYPALANDLLEHKRVDGSLAASTAVPVVGEPAKPKSGNRLRGGSWALSVGLLLCGIVVATVGYRDWIAQSALPRPVRAVFCNMTGCELPLRRAIDQLAIVNKSTYSHPTVENALIITIDLRNDAAFAQPYPSLSVMMANEQGRTVAQRSFASGDYLSKEFSGRQLPPGERVRIDLEVVDPGPIAKSFEIELF